MQTHRIISLASILAMILIPVIGWFFVAQPQFAAAALADTQRADIDAQATTLQATVDKLQADSEKLPELLQELDSLRGSIPADADSSAYLDGLNALASASGVTISALTVGSATAYAPAPAPEDPNAVATDAAAAEGDDATATQAPVAEEPVAAANPAFVTNPLITGDSFVTIPVTIDVTGSYDAVLNFIAGLQSGERLFLVSEIGTARDGETGAILGKIGGFIYAIPTGLPGDPAPVSTQVKIMDTPVVAPVETDAPEDEDGSTPTPTPTSTQKP